MTFEEFNATLTNSSPPSTSPLLRAMWHAARDEWDEAHRIAQDVNNRSGAWVHAYLHRQEGDLGNARYWYAQAGQPETGESLEQEWTRIVTALLETR